MRFKDAFIHTLREEPADAEVVSHKLMLRAGLIAKIAAGIYSYLPLGYRSIRKLEAIVREEMAAAGSTELLLPAIQPSELWVSSGRWAQYGPELLRLKDRSGRDFCVGPTHEEVVTTHVGNSVKSYRQLPVNLYQIQTKFRDEIRPRFGLMRGREFLMKDAYSFHSSPEDLELAYQAMVEAYTRIFNRCGLDFTRVEADTGNIGGSASHEFMVTAETGEDEVLACESCDYGANVEKAVTGELEAAPTWPRAETEPTEISTPDKRSIDEVAEFLGLDPRHLIKTLVVAWKSTDEEGLAIALIRGDREISEVKLKNALDVAFCELATPEQITEATGAPQGFAGPVGLEGLRIIADPTVMALELAATGANAADAHLVGVKPGRDFTPELIADINTARDSDPCARCDARLATSRGIEVGHVFKLGTKYSEPMKCTYLDENGRAQAMIMGCYGLGIGRTIAAAIEQNHDEKGVIWPLPLAPFEVAVISLNANVDEVQSEARRIYDELCEAGVDVILDDRRDRPGVKLNDADLIGFPLRVVVGKRGLAEGNVEISLRRDRERIDTLAADAVAKVHELLGVLREEITS